MTDRLKSSSMEMFLRRFRETPPSGPTSEASRGLWLRIVRFTCAAVMAALVIGIAPAFASDKTALKLHDDFEGADFSPSGGLYYKDNAEQRAGTYRIQREITRSGTGALEVGVTPRCKPGAGKCSERAEIWERPDVLAPHDATLWYAFSMRLGNVPPADDHRYVVAQWKRAIIPGAKIDYSPFLAIRLMRGDFVITIDSDAMPSRARGSGEAALACAPDHAATDQRPEVQQTRLLVAASEGAEKHLAQAYDSCASLVRVIRRGGVLPRAEARWIDFVFKIKPGPAGDGEIEVFADGNWIASVRGRIGHDGPDLGRTQYFKFGPYRDGGRQDRWRIFYDDFRRGPACEDVADAKICRQVVSG